LPFALASSSANDAAVLVTATACDDDANPKPILVWLSAFFSERSRWCLSLIPLHTVLSAGPREFSYSSFWNTMPL
jgi:hypothetical protein